MSDNSFKFGVVILGIFIFVLLSFVLNIRSSRKLRKISSSRPPLSKEDYVEQLKKKGFLAKDILLVYDEIHPCLPKGFSMYPDDDLLNMYEIDQGDLEDSLNSIFTKAGKIVPSKNDDSRLSQQFKDRPTAEYILRLLSMAKFSPDKQNTDGQKEIGAH